MKNIGVFLLIFVCALGCYAKDTVSFSRSKIGQGESVELIFSSDVPFSQAPNVAPLQEDFRLSGQQTRVLSSVVNGTVNQTYQLIYNVLPRRTGTLKVTGLSLNGAELPSLTLTVVAGGVDGSQKALTLVGEVSKNKIYQGASFVYTAQLFDPVGIADGDFMPPELAKADIQQLGKDELFTKMRNGQSVQVFQRQYLITPEAEGTYTLKPATFSGVVTIRRGKSQNMGELFEMGVLFDGIMGQQQPVFASADPVTIHVLPKPDGWAGWWLPSTQVTLSDSFQMPSDIKVGSTIERTITLAAQGVQAEDLPQITQPNALGLSVYPSPEKRETQHTAGTVTGMLKMSVVLVPTQAGSVTIPEISVEWFNTQTEQREVAVLPAKTIVVAGAIAGGGAQGAAKPVRPIEPEAISPVMVGDSDTASKINPWIMLVGGIFIGLLVMGAIVVLVLKRKAKEAQKTKPLPDLYPF